MKDVINVTDREMLRELWHDQPGDYPEDECIVHKFCMELAGKDTLPLAWLKTVSDEIRILLADKSFSEMSQKEQQFLMKCLQHLFIKRSELQEKVSDEEKKAIR